MSPARRGSALLRAAVYTPADGTLDAPRSRLRAFIQAPRKRCRMLEAPKLRLVNLQLVSAFTVGQDRKARGRGAWRCGSRKQTIAHGALHSGTRGLQLAEAGLRQPPSPRLSRVNQVPTLTTGLPRKQCHRTLLPTRMSLPSTLQGSARHPVHAVPLTGCVRHHRRIPTTLQWPWRPLAPWELRSQHQRACGSHATPPVQLPQPAWQRTITRRLSSDALQHPLRQAEQLLQFPRRDVLLRRPTPAVGLPQWLRSPQAAPARLGPDPAVRPQCRSQHRRWQREGPPAGPTTEQPLPSQRPTWHLHLSLPSPQHRASPAQTPHTDA